MKISKDEYILRTFSKIKHKKWELFVITRIIHLLEDPDTFSHIKSKRICFDYIKSHFPKQFKELL